MKNYFIILFIIFFILGVWVVVIEPYTLNIKRIAIKDSRLSGLKIVFASDFHIKPYEKFRLVRIVNEINAQKPDIVLLGGDYVNGTHGSTMPIEDISKGLSQIKSPMGTYGVLGNHDGWHGGYKVTKSLRQHNIKVLENSSVEFDKFILAGVEDMKTQHARVDFAIPKHPSKPVIFLTHNPDLFEKVPNGTYLTLAGHLHGGQVDLPLIGKLVVPSKFGKKFVEGNGFIKEDGKMLYTSKGLGTSILPVRFRCAPEIVVITFK